MTPALFRDITQILVINPYRRFGTKSPFFKGQEIQEFFTLENGKDRLSRNVGEHYHHTLHNMPEERRSMLSHYSVHTRYMYSTCQSTDVQLIALQIP